MKQFKRVLSLWMVLALLVSVQVVAADSSTNVDANNPVLKITEVSESVLATNTAYDLMITITNIGNAYGEDANLALSVPEDGPIVLTEQIGNKNIGTLNPNVTHELTYGIRVKSGGDPGFYTLTLEGVLSNDDGDQETYSEDFIVEVVKGNTEVDFEVLSNEATTYTADTEITADFILENRGKGTASDVTIAFGDNDDVGIYAIGDVDRYLARVGSMGEVSFAMDLMIDEDASGYTPITFEVTYNTGLSNETETVTTYVNVDGTEDGTVIIRSIDKSTANIIPGQKVTYTVVVENTSDVDVDYVKVSVSQETAIVPSSQSVVMIDNIGAKSTETVSFTLEATDSAESQNYPIEFTVTYDDTSTSQYSGVYITNDDDDDVVSQPRIIVTDFQISSEKIFVGDSFDIDFSVLNTSSLKDVRNLKVVVESSTSGSSTDAFMPLNQSNSYFVGDLDMQETSAISIPMKVFANAEGQSYSLTIEFEYEDLDGEFYTDSEVVHIPVYEKTELTVSDVSVGSSLDNGYTLQVDFYNTGKVDITNMMVDLEGDFAAANSNYYVGDFATGRTDVYDVEILGTQPSSITGTIVFTYDDTFGEEETFRKEFTIGETTESSDASGERSALGGGPGTANASGRSGVTELTDEQRTEMQNMSQEERAAFLESIQNGTSDQGTGFFSQLTYLIAGIALLIIAGVAFIVFRRKRKAD